MPEAAATMSPSTSAASKRSVEETKEQTSTSTSNTISTTNPHSSATLLSPKSSHPSDSSPVSRTGTASAGPSTATTARASRSADPTARAGGKKETTTAKKGKKVKIVEDAALVRRLIEHSQGGQIEALRHILQMEGDPRLDFEATAGEALTAAAEFGYPEAVTLLLDSGASPNCNSGRPLQRACAANQLQTATLLLAQGADPTLPSLLTGFTPLMCCCMGAPPPSATVDPPISPTAIRLTLPPLPPINPLNPLSPSHSSHPLSNASPSLPPTLISPHTPHLFHNSEPLPPTSRLPLLRLLLSSPSTLTSLNVPSSPYYCGPYNGWAPLHFAADQGRVDLIGELLQRGADLEVKTAQGDTALAIAAERGWGGVVEVLVANGADLNVRRRGLGVVEWCVYRGEVQLVEFCVAQGGKANLKTKVSWFPGGPGVTLLDVLKEQLSESLLDSLHLAVHRGGRTYQQKKGVRDVLLIFSWVQGGGEVVGEEGKVAEVKGYLPSTAIECVIQYLY